MSQSNSKSVRIFNKSVSLGIAFVNEESLILHLLDKEVVTWAAREIR